MKKTLVIVIVLFLQNIGFSQIEKSDEFHSWWNYSGNHKLNEKLSVHTLYSWRRNDFVSKWQQSLLRVGLNYKVTDNFIITPGYDWVVTYPYGEQPIKETFTEHRIFEAFTLKNKIGVVSIKQRYRLEQRIFSNSDLLRQRARYRLTLDVPLNNKTITAKTFYLSAFNEVFINFGKGANTHYFDQNWAYLGLGFKYNSKLGFKFGYMNQYISKSDFTHIENNHTLSFGLNFNLDFSKNDK